MKYTFALLLSLWAFTLFGQSFEGTITYSTDISISEKMKKMGITLESIAEKMKKDGTWADTIRTSYRNGNYFTLLNNTPRSWLIYKAETNKIYSFQDGDGADLCTVTDAAIDLEFKMFGSKPTIKKLDTVADVKGLKCSIVRVKWKTGTYDYYFHNSTLTTDPNSFSKHTYDGFADYLKISNALPVKVVKSIGFSTLTMTLVSYKAEIIDEKLFTIPSLSPDKELNVFKAANMEIMRIKK